MTPLLRDLVHAVPGLRASESDADRTAYSRDLWPRHHLSVRAGHAAGESPGAVAWPASTDEVAAIVRFARSAGIAVVPFGAGSGVCGAVSPAKHSVVVDMKRMDRVRGIDASGPFVEVEAGHMGITLERTLARAGFTLGHFPSSILCSTVGGWVATRSAGQCSSAYGKIEDMTAGLELVTGAGEIVTLRRRTSTADLVPLVVGSEGVLGIVTSATLRLHPAPAARSFGAWSFPTTRDGWEAMRRLFQAGLRPAVARLYDPFDALVAKRGARHDNEEHERSPRAGARRGALLRAILARPRRINALLDSRPAAWVLGGAMLLLVFEGSEGATSAGMRAARSLLERPERGRWLGEAPARRWIRHRYSVSYKQAAVFADGAFVDTMEVAAPWSSLEGLYEGVRRALADHAFVMAHLSHAYPDGCCIYFSFAGAARAGEAKDRGGWDEACLATYDRAWKAALEAATRAGGTIAHHHGVGRSKSAYLTAELGAGVDVVRSLMKAFDPAGILNPGNLVPPAPPLPGPTHAPAPSLPAASTTHPLLDLLSLLVEVDGATDLSWLEAWLGDRGLTLDLTGPPPSDGVAGRRRRPLRANRRRMAPYPPRRNGEARELALRLRTRPAALVRRARPARRDRAAPGPTHPLARRPGHRPPAHHVAVKVKHALPGVRALIHHEPVARLRKAELLRHGSRPEHHLSQRLDVARLAVVDARDVLLRNHEDVPRRSGADVGERHDVVVLEDDLRRRLALDDVAKETAHGARRVPQALGGSDHARSTCDTSSPTPRRRRAASIRARSSPVGRTPETPARAARNATHPYSVSLRMALRSSRTPGTR